MPAQESKPVDPATHEADEALETIADAKANQPEVESDDDDDAAEDETPAAEAGASASASKKKKKSKRKKIKDALTGNKSSSADPERDIKKAIGGLTPQQVQELMALNPALAQELGSAAGAGSTPEQQAAALQKLNLQDIMTGLASSGKNVKDMASYKFWGTQPVPRFGENEGQVEEGPLKLQKVEDVPKEPPTMIAGFEWVTMDLENDDEMKEVYELLNGHYVEDDEAMFRFNYSTSILKWALMAPGWRKEWHVGVRASQSRKLVAFISAIPVNLRVRKNNILCSEVNFICVHKKLRGKRLAPVLIKEITRRSNEREIWQGLYTAGVVLPTPVSTCRYYHRAINWQKLYEVGFSPLPPKQAQYQNSQRYMGRYDLWPEFDREEFVHWFIPKKEAAKEQVIWTYVVEDENKEITDIFSFYCLESSVIGNTKHQNVRAAYMFYYASKVGLAEPFDKDALKVRLNSLAADALVLAKRFKFDVFNALSIMDNGLFLEQQKFGPGDGQLHFYLFNYRANPIKGGVDARNRLDEDGLSGIGLAML
ncbi:glycylpeptide N-tetradecanoyltransferase [Verticillium alfalfae VaMs.102]|uniref:Glycylpeptide N-tetradecanoyltransferase n=1 Tax=Verticillium alfalfae (strain VaMs.102 / ATCC MYA-4576 / FGSC 10136) TaxID=526221 RepID=C9SF36_VERA1|nr:glycylpeptide N-tetradecanoyltransferase [Verticillium alfalfae VaMs.102]EEY17822.1 glycylpeptide N-tetradecanoyltransferase [Verticillium alfalfae VaMs.102]